MLKVNDVFTYSESKESRRVLYINNSTGDVITIALNCTAMNLRIDTLGDLLDSLEQGRIYFEVSKLNINTVIGKFSDVEEKLIEKRWQIIEYIINRLPEPLIYKKSYRSKAINEVIEAFGISKKSVYKYLRIYWQGGKVKSALVSDRSNCGGPGKSRISANKLGRKNGLVKSNIDKEGVNVTEEDKKYFMSALKKYRQPKIKVSLRMVYDAMCVDRYSIERIFDGTVIKEIKPAHMIPTFYQFRDFYYRQYRPTNYEDDLRRRHGQRDVDLNRSPTLNNTISQCMGPGHIYEIDATIPPVYLVSRLDKNRGIGKPIVYFVIDVYTKLIVGMHVGLNSASWNGLSSALLNCVEDKVEFCSRYDIDIKDEEWPNTPLPKRLLGDRGELISKQADNLAKNLNIVVDNTRSYMGKDKGNVEQAFRLSESKYLCHIDGVITNLIKKRGERDYRQDANMNIIEFSKIIIRTVIYHNNKIMEGYPLTADMLSDNVELTPVALWKWGVENISGSFNEFQQDYVMVHLMRKSYATVTEHGIRFNSCYYKCESNYLYKWAIKAKNSGRWRVEIRYDSRNLTNIYILDNINNQVLNAWMDEESICKNMSYEEVVDFNAYRNERKLLNRDKANRNIARLITGVTADVKNVRKSRKSPTCRKAMITDIKKNRDEEMIKYNEAINSKPVTDVVEGVMSRKQTNTDASDRDYLFMEEENHG